MNKFEKIDKWQYHKDKDSECVDYSDIELPKRATKYSAGYDIYSVKEFTLNPSETIKLPTGIKVHLDDDKFLMIVPRSGLGFKYKLVLNNTVGVIDADYINSDNDGHIWVKMTNESDKVLHVEEGEAIAQGIILSYFKTEDDVSEGVRNGGFGSTSN